MWHNGVVDLIGNASIMIAASVLVPFMLMCIMGLSHINFKWMGAPISNDIDRGKFLAIFLWNTSGSLPFTDLLPCSIFFPMTH
jgi:hypothetical protein